MASEYRKSMTTIFFDIVRHSIIICGTIYIIFMAWKYNWIFGIISVVPVYFVMLNLIGFLTVPLYTLTPENRAKSKIIKSLYEGDIESAEKQHFDFGKKYKINNTEKTKSEKNNI